MVSNPDQSWDQVVSSRIPSQYSQTLDRSLWQQWIDIIQVATGDDPTPMRSSDTSNAQADFKEEYIHQPFVPFLQMSSPQSKGHEHNPSQASSSSSSSSSSSLGSSSGTSGSSGASAAIPPLLLIKSTNNGDGNIIPPLSYPRSGDVTLAANAEKAAASNRALGKSSKAAFGLNPLSSANRKVRLGPPLSPPSAPPTLPPSLLQRLQQQSFFEGNSPPAPPTPSQLPNSPQIQFPTNGADSPLQPSYPQAGSGDSADALAILLPLLVLLSTLLLLLLLFLVLLVVVRRRARIALTSGDGPLDVGREEELEGAGGLEGVEERWLETIEEPVRRGYARAKDWLLSHPPASTPSEITISQFLSIQEKGVSAWSFEPDYEANSSCYVESRTEITFLADGEGMAPQEGGGCSVQSNLPLPKINEVYYWEAKMFTQPETTGISVGLATKPYPSFRLPGWSKFSVGFFSRDGFKCHNYPFAAQSYGPSYVQGDVIGVGYRPRTGTVFYTRNGKKLEDAYVGLHRYNLFPTIGADGPAQVHVNLGQAAFVFIEANVKKWGLAPMVGTLAPPPAYGQERGSILIETGQASGQQQAQSSQQYSAMDGRGTPPPPLTPPIEGQEPVAANRNGSSRRHDADATTSGSRSSRRRRQHGTQQGPTHPSAAADSSSSSSSSRRGSQRRPRGNNESPRTNTINLDVPSPRRRSASNASSTDGAPLNPPTPGQLDISLHSLRSSDRSHSDENRSGETSSSATPSTTTTLSDHSTSTINGNDRDSHASRNRSSGSYFPHQGDAPTPSQRGSSRASSSPRDSPRPISTSSPPPYSPAQEEPAQPEEDETSINTLNQPRRSSGRTHRLANTILGNTNDGSSRTNSSTSSNTSTSRIGIDGVEGEVHNGISNTGTWSESLNNWWSNNR